MAFKDDFAAFISYLKMFAFLCVAGGIGYLVYQRVNLPKPTAVITSTTPDDASSIEPLSAKELASHQPSEIMAPIMTKHLPALLSPLGETSISVSADLDQVEKAISSEKARRGGLQPSWTTAGRLCDEIRRTAAERNAAISSLKTELGGSKVVSVVPRSPAELKEKTAKMEFFKRSVIQRWDGAIPARRKKIDILYRQLLAAEASQGN